MRIADGFTDLQQYFDLLQYGAIAAIIACIAIFISDTRTNRKLDRQAKMMEEMLARLEGMEHREYERDYPPSRAPAVPHVYQSRPPVSPGRSTGE